MSNYINCQLKVEGPAAHLEELKNSIIISYKDHYNVDLKPLANGKDGVINSELFDDLKIKNNNMEILKNSFDDFEFNFRGYKTFYEWVSFLRFSDTTVWVDEEWEGLSLSKDSLIVYFTAAWTPPIIETMLGSKLYPDLKLTLSYKDISDGFEKGAIAGINGSFKEEINTYNN